MEGYSKIVFSNLDKTPDPIKSFRTMIIPAYYSYLNMSNKNTGGHYSLRGVALQCSNLLFNYREYLARVYTKNEMSHENIETACPDWGLLRDVSNAEKHFILDKWPSKYLNSISNVQEAMVYDTFLLPGNNQYVRIQIRVMILLNNYKIRDLLEATTNVLNFWGNFLLEKGSINEYEPLRYKGNDFISQEELGDFPKPKIYTENFDVLSVIGLTRFFDLDTNCFQDKYYIYHDAKG